jgi:hypothetical protein
VEVAVKRFLPIAALLLCVAAPADLALARGGRGPSIGAGGGGTRAPGNRRKKDQAELRLRTQNENRASLLRDARRDTR